MRWKCSPKRKRTGRLLGMLEAFDPKTIEDESLRQIVLYLMNVVETQQVKLAEQAEEIQRLRDEISRLKGEQGKPKIKANTEAPDLSSEKERRQPKPQYISLKPRRVRGKTRKLQIWHNTRKKNQQRSFPNV